MCSTYHFPNDDGSSVDVTVTTSVTESYTPAPVKPSMVVGMTYKGGTQPDLVTYEGLAYARFFAGSHFPDLSGVPAGIAVHPSIALGSGARPSDAFMNTYLARPGGGFITTDHEVNRTDDTAKPSPTQYKANCAWLKSQLDGHPNGASWTLVEIYDTYAQLNGQGQWQDYTSGNAIGWDTYDSLRKKSSYQKSSVLFQPFLDSGATFAPELGVIPKDSGDPTGSGAADAYASHVDFVRANGGTHLAFWGTGGTQYDYTPVPGSVVQWMIRRTLATQ